jgi:hypothetical protein
MKKNKQNITAVLPDAQKKAEDPWWDLGEHSRIHDKDYDRGRYASVKEHRYL